MSNQNLNDFEICEDLPDHHFRTEIPNIIFDLGLCANTLLVYIVLKRIAGDHGKCWKSIKNLAKQSNLGETAVRGALNHLSLETLYQVDGEFINLDKPLIEIRKRKRKDGGDDTNIIIINSIWQINGDFYREKNGKTKKDREGSPHEGGGIRHTRGGGFATRTQRRTTI